MGSEEGNRLFNEQALKKFREEMDKILPSLDDKTMLEQVADQNGVTSEEVRDNMMLGSKH